MEQSVEINELATALAKAQGEIENAPFDRENPHFKNRYATLASLRDASRAALSKHSLSIIQACENAENGGVAVVTQLCHASGQWMRTKLVLPVGPKNDAQGYGSALTYGRRYSWAGILGLASEEDDDANGASAKTPNGQAAERRPTPQPERREAPRPNPAAQKAVTGAERQQSFAGAAGLPESSGDRAAAAQSAPVEGERRELQKRWHALLREHCGELSDHSRHAFASVLVGTKQLISSESGWDEKKYRAAVAKLEHHCGDCNGTDDCETLRVAESKFPDPERDPFVDPTEGGIPAQETVA